MKSTRATVEYALSGDIEGTANDEYLMFYKSFDSKDPAQGRSGVCRTGQDHWKLEG